MIYRLKKVFFSLIKDDGGRSVPHHSQKMTNIYMRVLKNLIGQIELEFRIALSGL